MAGDAANAVLGAIAKTMITPVVDAIGRQFGYLFCYKSNIKNLKKKAAHLEKSRNDADNFFEARERNNEKRAESSAAWLKDAEEVIKDAKEVEDATAKSKGCLNIKDRYLLSRKSTKLAVEIRTLQNQVPKGITTNLALPAGRLHGASSNSVSKGYKTRMSTMNEVMKALEDHTISVIGICGLGGVGKTTLVHEVRERARKINLFNEVAMTPVSQNQDLFKIQGDLAEMLGLTSLKEERNIIARADQLHKRLTDGNKVLVILDDVWSDIKLKDIGIPVGSNLTGCKVVITSRQEGVCADIQKNIEVEVLSKEEARVMFKKTAGDCVERQNLAEIANEVADECGGLPIALLTLSKALSNKDRRTWEDARTSLREGSVTSIHGMEKEVYQSIKLSYDFLAIEKQKEAQSVLMLCCQLPEDSEIKVEKLARYCLSLELLEGVSDVVRARNRVYSLVEYLKSCFLVQAVDVDDEDKDWKDEMVKVHDVVRDVCLSIVSKVKEEKERVYMHIMKPVVGDGYEIGASEVDYPKLKLLIQVPLDHDHPYISFLQQTEELSVLESCPRRDPRSPDYDEVVIPVSELQFLTNLRMLSLEHGDFNSGVMSEFGRLTKLEILSFFNSQIVRFPREIRQLGNLKLLDLRCRHYYGSNFPSGIFSRLIKLEVLCMGQHHFSGAPYRDEDDSDEEPRGHISELDCLTNLTTLQVELLDPRQLLDLKRLRFEKLERFCFGSNESGPHNDLSCDYDSLCPLVWKALVLANVGIKWVFESSIQFIVRSTMDLSLRDIEDWTDPLIIEKFGGLRKLKMTRCNQLEYIIHDGDDGIDDVATHSGGPCSSSSSVFMNLQLLMIVEMGSIRELCHNGHLPAGSLCKLRELHLFRLPHMRHLWVNPTGPLCLWNLKVVKIGECPAVECIFPHSAAKSLVHLQKLEVSHCDLLEGIVSNGGGRTATGRGEIVEDHNDLQIHFPKLRYVIIRRSPNLRGFYNLHNCRVQPLFNALVVLPSMEKLEVDGLDKLKQIVGGKMPTLDWLQNLESVTVSCCESLKSVFDFWGQQVMGENTHVVTLGKLQTIELSSLPNLTHIFHCRMQEISVPELRTIDVSDCNNLENLLASNLIKLVLNLKQVKLEKCESIKAVFDFEGLEAMREDISLSALGELENITLRWLPKIEHLCRLVPRKLHVLQNLKRIRVYDCGSMAYLIPSSMAYMLVNLQELIVEGCKGMKEVCKVNEDCDELEKKIVFRSLRSVTLKRLENLSSFCSSDQQVFDFSSLESVSIIRCPEMESFCSQTLRVAQFGMLEANVSKGEGTTIEKEFNYPVVQFPKLKEVVLRDSHNLRGFYNPDNDTGRLRPLYNPLVMLPRLEIMRVDGLDMLKQLVGGRILDIAKFAASDWVRNLEKVDVSSCDSLESVFDFEEQQLTVEKEHVVKLGKLQNIELSGLPNLTSIFRCRMQDISVPELQEIYVRDCGKLGNLVACNLIKKLQNLKQVRVENCELIESVFDFEGLEVMGEDVHVIFGELQEIKLEKLPKLEHVCRLAPKEHVFQNLRKLELNHCNSLGHLISSSMAHMFLNLESLSIKRCRSMKEVIGMNEDYGMLEGITSKGEVASIQGEEELRKESKDLLVQFPKLKEIFLYDLANLRGFYNLDDNDSRLRPLLNPLVVLPSMVTLKCFDMHQLKQIVGGGMLASPKFTTVYQLQNLEEVIVRMCDSLESVFDFEGQEVMGQNAHVVKLSKLQKIELSRLPNLRHIFRCRMQGISVPELKAIIVSNCDNLVIVIASNLLKFLQNLQIVKLQSSKALEIVFDFEGLEAKREDAPAVLGNLGYISLSQLPKLEHVCRQVPEKIQSFQNLTSLHVNTCGSLSYLLSSSMAQMLVNLETLTVLNCKSMKEVIKMNEDCGQNKIVLRSLRCLALTALKKLSSFCSSDLQGFEFPSLKEVYISSCPEMKTFCSGHLTTEKLQGVYIHHDDGDYDLGTDDDSVHFAFYFIHYDSEPVWKIDLKETVQHFNASCLKEDDIDDSVAAPATEDDNDGGAVANDVDGSDAVTKDVDDVDNAQCYNEDTSSELAKTSVAPLIISSSDVSVEPLVVSSSPPVTDDNKELAYSPSSPDLGKAVALPNIVSSRSSASTRQSVRVSSDSLGNICDTSKSTPLEQDTYSKPKDALLAPLVLPSPSALEDDEELTFSSSRDVKIVAFPSLSKNFPSAPTESLIRAAAAENLLSDSPLSSPDNDWKRSRMLIQGVYVKSKMKATFEEILAANPNFLSGLRLNMSRIKTELIESAIRSLQILRNCTASTISSEQLAYIDYSLNDLVASGLDVGWLERGLQRANLVMEKQKAVSAAAELDRLDREKKEDEVAFEIARKKLEASTAHRDAFKAKYDALMRRIEDGEELYAGGFDEGTSLGDGLLD